MGEPGVAALVESPAMDALNPLKANLPVEPAPNVTAF